MCKINRFPSADAERMKVGTMHPAQWIPARLLMLFICVLPELSVRAASDVEHEGFCPNKLNSNLWVDAQSTCERECNADEDCADFEKCCTNVCGLNSCVAARFPDGAGALLEGQGGINGSDAHASVATCEGFICSQQGAVCDIWDGQPICKCQDRCEKEPNFTCASDGLTYFNRCYMDAEACVRGVTLTVITCRFYLAGPPTSALPQETTANPTPTTSLEDPLPPTLYSNPHHQSIYVGGTVSFHCDVIGVPRPDVTWEKQSELQERLVMRPDQMYGNVVITNIGQLVVYNAQVWDTGIYTCIARNSVGVLQADYPLSVIRRDEDDFSEDPELPMGRPFSPADCLAEVDQRACSGERHVDWYYDSSAGSCTAFSNGGCEDSRNRFATYEECKASCQREGMGVCSLPAVQGPCKAWEARWAWNSVMKECQAFVYGGCHGNANSFHTKKRVRGKLPATQKKALQGLSGEGENDSQFMPERLRHCGVAHGAGGGSGLRAGQIQLGRGPERRKNGLDVLQHQTPGGDDRQNRLELSLPQHHHGGEPPAGDGRGAGRDGHHPVRQLRQSHNRTQNQEAA